MFSSTFWVLVLFSVIFQSIFNSELVSLAPTSCSILKYRFGSHFFVHFSLWVNHLKNCNALNWICLGFLVVLSSWRVVVSRRWNLCFNWRLLRQLTLPSSDTSSSVLFPCHRNIISSLGVRVMLIISGRRLSPLASSGVPGERADRNGPDWYSTVSGKIWGRTVMNNAISLRWRAFFALLRRRNAKTAAAAKLKWM